MRETPDSPAGPDTGPFVITVSAAGDPEARFAYAQIICAAQHGQPSGDGKKDEAQGPPKPEQPADRAADRRQQGREIKDRRDKRHRKLGWRP